MSVARALALAAVVFWGASFVATKQVLTEATPLALICLRFALGTALLLAWTSLSRRWRRLPTRDLVAAVLLGLQSVTLHQLIQVDGLVTASAQHAGWLIGTSPVFAALLAWLFLGERLGPARLVGVAAAFAGTVLVVAGGHGLGQVLALPSGRGDLLVLASAVNWAAYSVLSRDLVRRQGADLVTTLGMTVGWAALVPFFFSTGQVASLGRLSGGAWVAVAFLGIACSGLGYLFWNRALTVLGAAELVTFLYLEPLVTVVTAWLLLGEPVRPLTVAGGLVILAGVAMVQRPWQRRQARPVGA